MSDDDRMFLDPVLDQDGDLPRSEPARVVAAARAEGLLYDNLTKVRDHRRRVNLEAGAKPIFRQWLNPREWQTRLTSEQVEAKLAALVDKVERS